MTKRPDHGRDKWTKVLVIVARVGLGCIESDSMTSVITSFWRLPVAIVTEVHNSRLSDTDISILYRHIPRFVSNAVFCPGFQKGMVPSEKGTISAVNRRKRAQLAQ